MKRDECIVLLTSLKKNVTKLPGGHVVADDATNDDFEESGEAIFGSCAVETTTLAPTEVNRPQTDLVRLTNFFWLVHLFLGMGFKQRLDKVATK